MLRMNLVRVLIAANFILGAYYLLWRYTSSINWGAWPIALALLAAETYSYIGAWLFGLTMWRIRERSSPPALPDVTVDVFITCYNEPVDVVCETVHAAMAIRYPHRVYLLDDGSSAAMQAMAEAEGAGYVTRSRDWEGHRRHAKAGNLNNALMQTSGEFLLILDADQIPTPEILDQTLGFFSDPAVALVQTQQVFYNVPPGDPFGSEAPLFYGPIQQGKDGWNAAFFCGSNAVLRREALMQLGVSRYVEELERRIKSVLRAAHSILKRAERDLTAADREDTRTALRELEAAVDIAQGGLRDRRALQDVTWEFQQTVRDISRRLVSADLTHIYAELADIPGIDPEDIQTSLAESLDNEQTLTALSSRTTSPLTAIETVRALLLAVDVGREDEAQPVMPMSTISVTEDMATAMRLHARGWKSVYHNAALAHGLAPEDLRSSLQQRLRWAQGTLQVMLRENPMMVRGLSMGQRLMYMATMWSYLSGFFSAVFLLAPILYLFFGILPVRAYSVVFFWHLTPYLIVNQILFIVISWRLSAWRGQQYSLALFPLMIEAVVSTVSVVVFGRSLQFVVTPKTRQQGVAWRLVWVQLAVMVLLVAGIIWALARLALGLTTDGVPILVNICWALYDLVMLSVVLDAVTYRPADA